VKKNDTKYSFWRDWLILLAAVTLALAALFFANDARRLGGIHTLSLEIVGRMTEPLAKVRSYFRLADENRKLRELNAVLQLKNAQMAEAWYENNRLRQLLGFRMTAPYDLIAARVIGRQVLPGMEPLLLDAGAEQGVRTNMTVVSADGLVGRIISVSSGYSTVQPFDDRSFSCAALVQRNSLQGMFKWEGYNRGILTGIYLSGDVRQGDVIVTSGANSIYVPGLKLGVVSFIDEAESGMYRKIYIEPKVDLARLREVYIIRKESTGRPR
jgi:rod shape-determining protein MreC